MKPLLPGVGNQAASTSALPEATTWSAVPGTFADKG